MEEESFQTDWMLNENPWEPDLPPGLAEGEEDLRFPYGSDVGRAPLLSPREERELFQRMEQGDLSARHRLVEANLRLVGSIAQKYSGRSLSFGDLLQEGTLGLIRAVDKYDYRRGYRFSTYSTWWIRQAITRALVCQDSLLPPPIHWGARRYRLRKVTQELQQQWGREPTLEELAEALNWSLESLQELQEWDRDPISLDQPVREEGEETWGDLLVDSQAEAPTQWVEQEGLREQVEAALKTLTPRQQEVLRLRFGLDDGWGRTLKEIGQQLGVSRERIRQIESRALQKLRDRFSERP